jgi:hypothetical protein
MGRTSTRDYAPSKQSEVRTHSDARIRAGGGSGYAAALNVKVYNFPGGDELAQYFPGADPKEVQAAAEFAWDSLREGFWRDAEEVAKGVFGDSVKVYSAGRQGGWLWVDGIGGPGSEYSDSTWKPGTFAKWRKFARLIGKDIDYRQKVSTVVDEIRANEWVRGTWTITLTETEDSGDEKVTVRAHSERDVRKFATDLYGADYVLGIATAEPSEDTPDFTLDRNGVSVTPIVTVKGGVAEEFTGNCIIVDFDNLFGC